MKDTLDSSLELREVGTGEFHAHASPSFDGNGAIFGGWTAALMTRAVMTVDTSGKRVLSLAIHYLRPIVPGADLKVTVLCLRGGRTLSQWRCEAFDEAGAMLATAQICTGLRIETERFLDSVMPTVRTPDELPPTHVPFACFEHMEKRFEHGTKWFTNEGTSSLVWARFDSDVPLDAARLAYLSDISPPRSYYVMSAPRPTPTVMMTVNLFATAAELAATAGQFVLCDLLGTRMEEGFSGAVGRIWTKNGTLLATTEQLQWAPV